MIYCHLNVFECRMRIMITWGPIIESKIFQMSVIFEYLESASSARVEIKCKLLKNWSFLRFKRFCRSAFAKVFIAISFMRVSFWWLYLCIQQQNSNCKVRGVYMEISCYAAFELVDKFQNALWSLKRSKKFTYIWQAIRFSRHTGWGADRWCCPLKQLTCFSLPAFS